MDKKVRVMRGRNQERGRKEEDGLDHMTAILGKEYPGCSYAFDPGDMRTEMHRAAFPNEDIKK